MKKFVEEVAVEEFKRKLASVQVIDSVGPIEGADRIQVATMKDLGWQCVIKKDEVKVGDKVVYFEVDSILPEKPEFEFLRERKFRIKTIKLKKQISQGLVIPIPEGIKNLAVGTDVTEWMGVKKHDPQGQEEEALISSKHRSVFMRFLMGFSAFRWVYRQFNSKVKGDWPSFACSKTDEERIQTCAKILMSYYHEDWYVTEKCDGQSATFFTYFTRVWGFMVKKFGVCSRNIWLKTKDHSNYWKIADKFEIERKLRNYNDGVIVVQGEIVGPSIQKNKYNRSELDFYVFNVYMNGEMLSPDYMTTFCESVGLKTVPILNRAFNPANEIGDGKEVREVVDFLVKMSQGDTVLTDKDGNTLKRKREGLVIRLVSDPRVSFKVINPQFLLEEGE